jgi:hypothetical protein
MQQDIDKLISVHLLPHEQEAADCALAALLDLWRSAKLNRMKRRGSQEKKKKSATGTLTVRNGVVE